MPPCSCVPGFARSCPPHAFQGEICLRLLENRTKDNGAHEPQLLPFRELEPFTRALLSVLFAFVRARVPRQKSELFQLGPQLGIEFQQRSGDSKPGRARLAGQPAAIGENEDVELVRYFSGEERLADDSARRFTDKILFEGPSVDRDLAL